MDDKAMIVRMSRRICVDLYEALIKLCPEWEGAGTMPGPRSLPVPRFSFGVWVKICLETRRFGDRRSARLIVAGALS